MNTQCPITKLGHLPSFTMWEIYPMLFEMEWKDLAAGQSINFTPIKSLPYTQTHKLYPLRWSCFLQTEGHVGQGISVWNMWAPAVCEARPPGNNKYKVGTLPLETLEAYWYILPALGDFNPSEVCNVEAHPVPVNNTPAIETAGSWTYWWCTCSVPRMSWYLCPIIIWFWVRGRAKVVKVWRYDSSSDEDFDHSAVSVEEDKTYHDIIMT